MRVDHGCNFDSRRAIAGLQLCLVVFLWGISVVGSLPKVALAELSREPVGLPGRWQPLGPAVAADPCTTVAVSPHDPEIAFLGCEFGLWRTTNGGVSWTVSLSRPDLSRIRAIEIADDDSSRLWVAAETDVWSSPAIFGSDDGGRTWWEADLPRYSFEAYWVDDLEYNPVTGTVFAASYSGLWRSEDGGHSFDYGVRTGEWTDVQVSGLPGGDVWAVAEDQGFSFSFDDGVSWGWRDSIHPDVFNGPAKLAVSPLAPERIYMAATKPGHGLALWRSDDSGSSFRVVASDMPVVWKGPLLKVDPTDADHLLYVGAAVYASHDGGETLQQTGVGGLAIKGLAWSGSDPERVWFAAGSGCHVSRDDGTTYYDVARHIQNVHLGRLVLHPEDAEAMLVARISGPPAFTRDGQWLSTLGHRMITGAFDPSETTTFYVVTDEFLFFRTDDGGLTWREVGAGLPVDRTTGTIVADMERPGVLWSICEGKLWRSEDYGETWYLTFDPGSVAFNGHLRQCRRDPSVLSTLGDEQTFWLSNDDGETWELRTDGLPPPATGNFNWTDMAVDPADPDRIIITVTGDRYPAYLTTDRGTQWLPVDGPWGDSAWAATFDGLTGWIYVAAGDGVWVSCDEGRTWSPIGLGLPLGRVVDVELHESRRLLVVTTRGFGLWRLDLTEIAAKE